MNNWVNFKPIVTRSIHQGFWDRPSSSLFQFFYRREICEWVFFVFRLVCIIKFKTIFEFQLTLCKRASSLDRFVLFSFLLSRCQARFSTCRFNFSRFLLLLFLSPFILVKFLDWFEFNSRSKFAKVTFWIWNFILRPRVLILFLFVRFRF